MKEKIGEIQILRGFAILAVVLIHLFNLGLTNVKAGMNGYWFFQIAHSLFQFAVPCFILISSITLAYTNQQGIINYKRFYISKFKRLVIPFFMWTFFFLIVKFIFNLSPEVSKLYQLNSFVKGQLLSVDNWVQWLLFGKAYTHLYFMSIMIQFVIMAPMLLWLVRWITNKFKERSFAAVLYMAVLPQIAIYWINRLYIYSRFKYTATMLIWYWCILILGLWIGLNYKKFVCKISEFKYWIISASVVFAIIYIWYRIAIIKGEPISTFYYQMIYYLYVILASLSAFILSISMYDKRKVLSKYLNLIGRYSFGIYLMHPVITLIMSKIVKTSNVFFLVTTIFIGVLIIMFVCVNITKRLEACKYTSFLVGKYQKNR